jgi:hypothetical protein
MKYVNSYWEYNIVKQFKLSAINLENDENDIQFEKILEAYKESFFNIIKLYQEHE